jgi:hypothetical protein
MPFDGSPFEGNGTDFFVVAVLIDFVIYCLVGLDGVLLYFNKN